MEWVLDTAYSILLHIIKKMTGEWSNQAWTWFSSLFSPPLAVLEDPVVVTLTQVAVAAAIGFLPAVVAWKALHETFARMDGAATMAPETLVRRTIITGAAVTGTSLVAWFIGTLAEHARNLLAAVGIDINLFEAFFFVPPAGPTTAVILTLVFLVGAIILSIQRVVIMAEFTVLICVGPLMAAGLMREGSGTTWAVWVREVVSLVLTPIIQMLVLLLFIRKYGGAGPMDMMARAASLGFLWVLWNTPRWARQMVYQVGAGGAVVNAVGNMGRMAAMRYMARAAIKA
ncbi:MAG: conjugal transfer protein TrbL family protein [Bacillota bacterium]